MHRLRYKVLGPKAKLNFELSHERRAELDATSVEEELEGYRRSIKETRSSRYLGVTWYAHPQMRWRAYVDAVHMGRKRRIYGSYHKDEEAAARQADE